MRESRRCCQLSISLNQLSDFSTSQYTNDHKVLVISLLFVSKFYWPRPVLVLPLFSFQNKANGCSLLLQQNTDSLESRDDDIKDSFETALSSLTSSLSQVKKIADVITTNTTLTNKAQSTTVPPTTQYQRDQVQSPPKAIVTAPPQPVPPQPAPPPVQINTVTPYKAQTRGLLKQQDSVDLNQTPMANSQDVFHDAYLEPQESLESYVEDDADVVVKPANHDSPSSVIHVDEYEEEQSLRRGSSQITVVDPYHPSLDYAPRRLSAANARGYPNADEAYSRKPSIVDTRRISPTQQEEILGEPQVRRTLLGRSV